MGKKLLTPEIPPTLAVAEGASSPNPGGAGAVIWSSTTGAPMVWNGSAWYSAFPTPGKIVTATETVAAGAWVNLYETGGNLRGRNADATAAGEDANGWTPTGGTNGNPMMVLFGGINTGVSGLTPGRIYFLHTTPGSQTLTPPSANGNVVQKVGIALSATELLMQLGMPIELVV